MAQYLLRRVQRLVLVWLGVSLLAFFLLHLTGDPARAVLGELASAEALAAFRQARGLDQPLVVQYLAYMGGVLRGDFGTSFRFDTGVLGLILERIPATLELTGASLLISLALGVPLGALAALRQNTWLDYGVRLLVLLGQAVPSFLLGLISILVFAAAWKVLPSGGRGTPAHLVLPALVLSLNLLGLMLRITRSAVLDLAHAPYVRTARAKGLPEGTVVVGHLMRNAWLPVVTVLGVQIAMLLSGAVVTEVVFSWPGIGRLLVSAILARDFPLVQGAVLLVASAVVLVNFAVDVTYGYLDPRIRLG